DTIGSLRDLRILSLRKCQIAELPDSMGELDNLLYLDLRANPLTSLPESIADLPKLEKLDLRWTHDLETLPGWVDDLRARGCLVYK
ncbi:MAG: hypothetical protein AAFR67_14455, partial [Chloroflexota bacterium]